MRGSLFTFGVAVLACCALGCGDSTELAPTPDTGSAKDAGCSVPCSGSCCEADEVCDQGVCRPICERACEGRECGPDGCGGQCGTCQGGFHCTKDGKCEPDCYESDEAFCQRLSKQCGVVEEIDACGEPRIANCGSCKESEICDPATNLCECFRESDAEYCERLGIQCGPAEGPDRCGDDYAVAECGPCTEPGERCEEQKCVICVPELDGDFCARHGKNCGTLAAYDNCGWREAPCGGCTEPETCGPNLICTVEGKLANDTCSSPEKLVFGPDGTVTTVGDTARATADTEGSCGGKSGHDLVYEFDVPQESTFEATVTPPSIPNNPFTPMLRLESECAVTEHPGACTYAPAAGSPAKLVIGHLPAGHYFLWVDATNDKPGAFTLEVRLSPPQEVPGETCLMPVRLTLDEVTQSVSVQGDTSLAADDGTGLCETAGGPDLYYLVTVPQEAAMVVTLTRDPSSPTYQPSFHVRSDCEEGDPTGQLGCVFKSGAEAKFTVPLVPPGDYIVAVDGHGGRRGKFTLTVQLRPPIFNENCQGAEELSFETVSPGVQVASVDSDNSPAANDYEGNCVSDGKDLVFKVTLTEVKDMLVEMTSVEGSKMRPTLYMRSVCEDPDSELICTTIMQAGASVRFTRSRLRPGSYYIFVDDRNNDGGAFNLTVQLTDVPPPPANDVCDGAQALVVDPTTGTLSLTGETTTAFDDYTAASTGEEGTCPPGPTDGPDIVYSLKLEQESFVAATLARHPADNGFRPAIYLRSDCPQSSEAPDLACERYVPFEDDPTADKVIYDSSSNKGWADIVVPSLPAGTYFLIIDGGRGSAGRFTLDLTVLPSPQPGDCSWPIDIPLNENGVGTAEGDNRYRLNQTRGSCGGQYANEVVFRFTTGGMGSLSILLEQLAGSGQASSFFLRTACDDPDSEVEGACKYALTGGSATIDLPRIAGGTYYLIVDDFARYLQGPVRVTVTSQVFPEINDTCDKAKELVFAEGEDLVVVDNVNWLNGEDDYAGSCHARMEGIDHVYYLDVTQDTAIQVRAEGSVVAPDVYIRSVCESSSIFDELGCGPGSSRVAVAGAPRLVPGRYYIFVDAFGETSGTYRLEVTRTTPPSGDTCASAEELKLDAEGTAKVQGDTSIASNDAVGGCQASNMGDLVYKLVLDETKDVVATAAPLAGDYRAYLYVRTRCTDPSSEIGCAWTTLNTNRQASISLKDLSAGTYFIFVDTPSATSYRGPFELTVTATEPAARPANDTCEGAQELVFDPVKREATQPGTPDTRLAKDHDRGVTGDCGNVQYPLTGGDLVYYFTLTEHSQVTVALERTDATYKQAVYLRTVCDQPASEVFCDANTSSTVTALASFVRALPAGTYYVFVDGAHHSGGTFTLRVSAPKMAAGDACFDAQPVSLVLDEPRILRGDSTGATNMSVGSCNGNSGPDVVYTFTTFDEADLTVSAKADGSTYRPYVYLRGSCDDPGTERGCGFNSSSSGGTASFKVYHLPAGTWYLWVDSYGSSATTSYPGKFEVTLLLSKPVIAPPNDVCANAVELVFPPGSNVATGEGTTLGAHNDYDWEQSHSSEKCQTASSGSTLALDGPDVVYYFRLAQPAVVTVDVQKKTSTPDYLPAVLLRSQCADSSQKAKIACRLDTTSAGLASSIPTALGAGTYYVIVDGVRYTAGDFTVKVTADPAVKPGDSCFNPVVMNFDANGVATTTGDITDYTHLGEGTCYLFGNSWMPDMVFSFELREPRAVRIEATPLPGSNFRPYLWVRSVCEDKFSELPGACKYAIGVEPNVLELPQVPAGTHYIFAKTPKYDVYGGPFRLDVTAYPPPENDSCEGAQRLDLSEGAVKLVSSLGGSRDHSAGTCGGKGFGDVVYWFDLMEPSKMVAKVTRTPLLPDFEPVVYLRTACGSEADAHEVTCGRPQLGTAAAMVRLLEKGTYYVIVDAASLTVGEFRLELALERPEVGAANESCYRPEPVVPSSASLGDTTGAVDETSGSCSAPGASDLVYRLSLSQAQGVRVTVVPVDPGFQPAVYIRSRCGGELASDERVCAAAGIPGATVTATAPYLAPGDYFIWVDGATATAAGAFSLTVDLLPPVTPPANDQCAGAQALTLGQAVNGSTAQAVDDYGAALSETCLSGVLAGPDVVYTYTPASHGPVKVTLTPSNWDAAIWVTLGEVCGGPGDWCMALGNDYGPGGAESVTFNAVAGMTYYLIVDGPSRSDAGAFTLRLE